jgi:hypothetical protein
MTLGLWLFVILWFAVITYRLCPMGVPRVPRWRIVPGPPYRSRGYW